MNAAVVPLYGFEILKNGIAWPSLFLGLIEGYVRDPTNAIQANYPHPISRGGIRTRTGLKPQGILSPLCLPFHHAASLQSQTLS